MTPKKSLIKYYYLNAELAKFSHNLTMGGATTTALGCSIEIIIKYCDIKICIFFRHKKLRKLPFLRVGNLGALEWLCWEKI